MEKGKNGAATLEQKLYLIEREYKKRIDPVQSTLDGLKERQEAVLSRAQKEFETNEKEHQVEIQRIEKTHARKKRELEKEYTAKIDNQTARITEAERNVQKELEAISANHEKTAKALKKEIEEIEGEIAGRISRIDEKRQESTKVYEEKIDLYEQNLETNKKACREILEEALEKLKKLYSEDRRRLSELEKTIEKAFRPLEKRLDKNTEDVKAAMKREDNALQHRINTVRRDLNKTIKEITTLLTEMEQRLKRPFFDFEQSLNDVTAFFKAYEERFQNRLRIDVNAERTRLSNLAKKQSKEGGEEPDKELEKQIELNIERQNALKDHTAALKNAVEKTLDMFKSMAGKTRETIEETLEQHEKLINEHQTKLKRKFDLFQNQSPKLVAAVSDHIDKQSPSDDLDALKTFFHSLFKAFYEFETERLKAVADTTRSLVPLYAEADDIRYFLDVKDALKEIRIRKERIEAEKRETRWRLEMKKLQKEHEIRIARLERDYALEEKRLLNHLHVEKEKQYLADLKARRIAALQELGEKRDEELAACRHELRKKQNVADKAQIEKRHALEKERLDAMETIRLLEAERDAELHRAEHEEGKTSERIALELEMEKTKKRLNRIDATIERSKRKLESELAEKERELQNAYREKTDVVEKKLKDLEQEHERQIGFIDKALRRETENANANIENVKGMARNRLEPLEERAKEILDTLEDHRESLQKEGASLKELLAVAAASFRERFVQTIELGCGTLQDADNFLFRLAEKEAAEEMPDEKKRNAHVERLAAMKERSKKNHKKEAQEIIDDFTSAHKAADKELRRHKTQSIDRIRNVLSPLSDKARTLVEDYASHVDKTLEKLFYPLMESDVELIERAENSSLKAKEEAQERHREERIPLEKEGRGIQSERDKALRVLKEEYDAKISESREPVAKEQKEMLARLEGLEKKIAQNGAPAFDEKKERETRGTRVREQMDERRKRLDEHFDAMKKKVDERLDDALVINESAKENAESAREEIENTLETTLEANQEAYDKAYRKMQDALDDLGAEKKTAIEEENGRIKRITADHEQRAQSASDELDDRIEDVSRKIEDEARIKRARKEHLEEIVGKREKELQESLQKACDRLGSIVVGKLEEAPFEALDHTSALDELFDEQDTLIDAYVEETKRAIKTKSSV